MPPTASSPPLVLRPWLFSDRQTTVAVADRGRISLLPGDSNLAQRAAERGGIHGRRLAARSLCFNFLAHSLEPRDHPVVYCDLRRLRLGRLRELCSGKRDGFGSIFGFCTLVDHFEQLSRLPPFTNKPDLDAVG
jgi:hypothetical protein